MVGQKHSLLNRLERDLPEGLLADTAWLREHGYSRQLLSHYVAAGWLEQPARGVYRRHRGKLTWQQAVISLQMLLEKPLVVGGRTALELQGYAHYLAFTLQAVHLYGPEPLPKWAHDLTLDVEFRYHNDRRLFHDKPINLRLNPQIPQAAKTDPIHGNVNVVPWGQWEWPLILSTVERAYLEFLDELPQKASFDLADKLMEGLTTLRPTRLQKLLADCRSVKVKRLFFFFADRHRHPWLKRLDKTAIDLGTGKRLLAKGGRLDRQYQITVPEDLYAVS